MIVRLYTVILIKMRGTKNNTTLPDPEVINTTFNVFDSTAHVILTAHKKLKCLTIKSFHAFIFSDTGSYLSWYAL